LIEYEQTGVRSFVQGLLLGHPIHTILYTIPPLPTAPLQERKLTEGERGGTTGLSRDCREGGRSLGGGSLNAGVCSVSRKTTISLIVST
jgi:hypothetical protein